MRGKVTKFAFVIGIRKGFEFIMYKPLKFNLLVRNPSFGTFVTYVFFLLRNQGNTDTFIGNVGDNIWVFRRIGRILLTFKNRASYI